MLSVEFVVVVAYVASSQLRQEPIVGTTRVAFTLTEHLKKNTYMFVAAYFENLVLLSAFNELQKDYLL